MDTIDISNLNRQFLFRKSDVGKFKAEVAARFVEKRVRGVNITPYNCKIQDFDEEFYMQFQLVVCGLDSIEARRWINAMLVNMVDVDVDDSFKPLIDGGTEGKYPSPYNVLAALTNSHRLQGTSEGHLPDCYVLYRVPARHARPARRRATLYPSQHPPTA